MRRSIFEPEGGQAKVMAAQQARYRRARCNPATGRSEYNASEDVYYANDRK
jgi:hypothetical protein